MKSARGEQATTKAVGYVRVSLAKMGELSLDAQEAKLRAYCALYAIDLVAVVVDAGASAKSLDRPGLARALGMLESGAASALLVCKLDRLTRSVADLGRLVEGTFNRFALLSVSEQIDTRSAGGRLVLNVLASVGQWEREAIGERTSAALQHKKAQGFHTGGRAPFGYSVAENGSLVAVESEQATIEAARALRNTGATLQSVADSLAARGMVARSGKPFAAMQVLRMVAEQVAA